MVTLPFVSLKGIRITKEAKEIFDMTYLILYWNKDLRHLLFESCIGSFHKKSLVVG